MLVFEPDETPGFSEMFCATGRTVASTVTFAVFFAATVVAVFVVGLVTSEYAAVHVATAAATLLAVVLVCPYVDGLAVSNVEKFASHAFSNASFDGM